MSNRISLLRYTQTTVRQRRLAISYIATYPLPTSHHIRNSQKSSHSLRVQVFVARGRSEWFVRVAVSAGVLVGLTPAVMVAAPAPAWPSIPMTVRKVSIDALVKG